MFCSRQPFSLASRGAKFHDATYFTVYRNVSARISYESFLNANQSTASHNLRNRHTQRVSRRMVHRASIHRAARDSVSFRRRVHALLAESILLNEPDVDPGLTGAFLFASTSARSSLALLGWNCGYAFFSNVGELDCRYDATPTFPLHLLTNVPF
jgi:hypothetical protein